MSGYEDASLTEIEAVLDGLDEATSSQVYYATKGYQARAVAAVAASRADAGGGGGLALSVIGPFTVDFDDPNVNSDIIALTALTADDWILNVWSQTTVPWVSEPAAADHILLIGVGDEYAAEYTNWSGTGTRGDPTHAGIVALPKRVLQVQDGDDLYVEIYAGNGNFTAGQSNFYALVYTPA